MVFWCANLANLVVTGTKDQTLISSATGIKAVLVVSSLHWDIFMLLSCFCSTGVYSDYNPLILSTSLFSLVKRPWHIDLYIKGVMCCDMICITSKSFYLQLWFPMVFLIYDLVSLVLSWRGWPQGHWMPMLQHNPVEQKLDKRHENDPMETT